MFLPTVLSCTSLFRQGESLPSHLLDLSAIAGDLTLALLGLPLLTLVVLLLTGASLSSRALYTRGLVSSGVSLIVVLLLTGSRAERAGGFSSGLALTLAPATAFPLPLHLGLDGLSLPFLLLTNLIQFLTILSLRPATPRLLEALLALLFLQWSVLGSFLSLDLLAFFLFFERSLLPIYFLVLLWGSRERRVRASYRISLYTLFGSIFRLFNLLYLYGKTGTTEYELLLTLRLPERDQRFLWLTFFLAFAAKIPLFPLHIWLPEAHVEAPTIGSVLLAALLLKLGSYGLLRFALPLFPEGTVYFAPLVSTLALRGVVYTSLTALRQIDLKKIIAYSSVGHRNIVLLGLRAESSEALQGALFQRISHGIVSGGLFFAVGVLYERYAVRSLKYFGGVAHLYPLLTLLFLLLSRANISFPLTSSFVGEFLILAGLRRHSFVATLVASTSRVLGAAYTLWAANRIFFGNIRSLSLPAAQDLTVQEAALFAPLVFLVLALGILPNPFLLDRSLVDIRNLLEHARLGRI
jgi:NADH-quinone oxidoreductase subunit M